MSRRNADQLYRKYKNRAKERGHDFYLTIDEFLVLTKSDCYLCGQSPRAEYYHHKKRATYGEPYIYNGIDRVRNDQGYIIENCKACCSTCNYMKHRATLEEFLKHVFKIVKFHLGVE